MSSLLDLKPEERLLYRLDRAQALLMQVSNQGLASFNSLNPEIQDNYVQVILEQIDAAMVDYRLVQMAHEKELEHQSKH